MLALFHICFTHRSAAFAAASDVQHGQTIFELPKICKPETSRLETGRSHLHMLVFADAHVYCAIPSACLAVLAKPHDG